MQIAGTHSKWPHGDWFWAIVGVALLFRLWGIWYGLPFSYWVDEYHEVMRALELGSGGFNLERVTKGGFYLVLFVEYGAYYLGLKIFGIVDSPKEFAEHFVRDPSALYLIGRVTAAVIGAATVAAVYFLARAAYSIRAALIGALMLALNVLHVDLSRRIGVDIPMALMATLALYYGVRLSKDGRRRDYLLAGTFAALAITTKLPGILVVLPLVIAHAAFIARSGRSLSQGIASPNMWLAAGLIAVVVVATNPGIILTTGYVSRLYESQEVEAVEESLDVEPGQDAAEAPNLYFYYLIALKDSMGWPLFGLAAFSVAYAAWRRTAVDVMLLAYALANYLAIASTSSDKLYYPRYTIPVVIVLAILSGRVLSDLAARFGEFQKSRLAIVLISLLAWPVWQSAVAAHALTQTDTRTIAKEWIERNIPPGSRVLIEGLKIGPIKGTVQLKETPAAIKRRLSYWRIKEPKQAKFLELQLAVHEGVGYDLELIRVQSVKNLDSYVDLGVQFFVIRPAFFLSSRRSDAASDRFYDELRSSQEFVLLERFEGGASSRPGVTIEVYGPLIDSGEAN